MYQINDSTHSVQIKIVHLDLLHLIGNNIKNWLTIAQNSTKLFAAGDSPGYFIEARVPEIPH